jgi:triosephosphate isomerase (TIM)
MSRKKIVAGNWKMNTTKAEALELVNAIVVKAPTNGVQKIIIPPYLFLSDVSLQLNTHSEFFCGAQNCSEFDKGAYTGEVSAAMLQSVGCNYVLVGHSERRTYFKETTEQLIAKINQALANNLNVIFCFGEQLAHRKSGNHFETVKSQLHDVLKNYPINRAEALILAYEPVWAIGTGETASPEQAQEMHAFIRKELTTILSEAVAQSTPILYGGSCNAQNAHDLFACEDVDGGLIGGASLKADDFCKIITAL